MKQVWKIVVAQFILLIIFSSTVLACPFCRAQVESGIYDRNFFSNLFVMLLPIVILTAIGFGLYHADKISDRLKRRMK
jgi:hypothetical protein